MSYTRPFVLELKKALEEHPSLIHVVLGPRQIGKTTGVLQLLKARERTAEYVSADSDIARPSSWIMEQWLFAQSKPACRLLVIDEIQKVQNWSEAIKTLWDEQKKNSTKNFLKLILLGSSSLDLQKGLSESLTGRYYSHRIYHWSFEESQDAFDLSFDEYLTFGGYPASYAFRKKKTEWLRYIRHSLIDPVLGRDILSLSRVKSPALFRQCFDLACSYAAREMSYTKLLGQLQERGNTELVKHYLELFEGAFLLKQIFQFSTKKILSRSSSPKLLPLCPALYSASLDADLNSEEKGRAFEVVIGHELTRCDGNLFYWREGSYEVDFVLQRGKRIIGIEVKTTRNSMRGLEAFKRKFKNADAFIVKPENYRQVLKQIRAMTSG